VLWQGVNWAAREVWNTTIFSPRPFVTHWVNALGRRTQRQFVSVPGSTLAALAATLCWACSLRAGILAWGWTAVLGIARIFCGSNYPIDVFAGWVLGWALAALALALCHVSLRLPARGGGRLRWRRKPQATLAGAAIAIFIGATLLELLGAPRALRRNAPLLASSTAKAAFEKAAPSHDANGLPLDGRYGRQPRAEAALGRKLKELDLAHRISDIEVAQIFVGAGTFRVAAISFEAQPKRAGERREVAKTAARAIRAAFHADPTLQNVDAQAVIFSNAPGVAHAREAEGEGASGQHLAEPRPLPVFTASVQKRNLRIINGPPWANARGVDDGLWLRARSRLFIDPQVLPPLPDPTIKPTPTPQVLPLPPSTHCHTSAYRHANAHRYGRAYHDTRAYSGHPRPLLQPTSTATPAPTATARPTATPKVLAVPVPRATAAPRAVPTPRRVVPTPRPAPKPRPRPTAARRAPVQRAPVHKAPVRRAPVRKALVHRAPVRPAPVRKAPVRPPPVRKAVEREAAPPRASRPAPRRVVRSSSGSTRRPNRSRNLRRSYSRRSTRRFRARKTNVRRYNSPRSSVRRAPAPRLN
jgi:hypothetical protein